jgi:hypothetical protein
MLAMTPSFLNDRYLLNAEVMPLNWDVRFTPQSGHQSDIAECPLCARSRLMHCSEPHEIVFDPQLHRQVAIFSTAGKPRPEAGR